MCHPGGQKVPGYGILRVEKIKASSGGGVVGRLKHDLRETSYENERTEKNQVLEPQNSGDPVAWQTAFARYKKITEDCKKRSDSVGAIEVVITSSERPDMTRAEHLAYLNEAQKWAMKKFGLKNCFLNVLHMDEKVPHIHLMFAPVEETERLKKQTAEERRAGVQRHEKIRQLNAKKWLNGKKSLSAMQTEFFENVSKKYGFERGELAEDTHRTHSRIRLDGEIARYKKLNKELSAKIEFYEAWKATQTLAEGKGRMNLAEMARGLTHDELNECWRAFERTANEKRAEKARQTHENGPKTGRSGRGGR